MNPGVGDLLKFSGELNVLRTFPRTRWRPLGAKFCLTALPRFTAVSQPPEGTPIQPEVCHPQPSSDSQRGGAGAGPRGGGAGLGTAGTAHRDRAQATWAVHTHGADTTPQISRGKCGHSYLSERPRNCRTG